FFIFFFSSRRRHTRFSRDWSSDVCSSDLIINIYNGFLSLFQPTKRYFLDLTEFEKAEFIEKNKINLYYIYASACYELYSLGLMRSEERRVGKECRYRLWREHEIAKIS